MIKSGHDEVARLGFQPRGRQAGIEVLSWPEVEARGGLPQRSHRTEFHILLLVDEGRLPFQLDFIEADRGPRSLLWARPGQVQQFGCPQSVQGQVLLFVTEFPAPSDDLTPLLTGPRPPWTWTLSPTQHARAAATFQEIHRAATRADEPLHLQVVQHALTAMLLSFGALTGRVSQASGRQDVFARIHEEIERSYSTSRRAEDLARRLGYSTKTLNRAAHAATGLTVKQLIDDRVTLEAKRLLAHTDAPAETIAHQLGFTQATNFARFFTTHSGETAGAFRRRVRGL